MSKLEQLQTEIYKIDGNWYHVGKKLTALLNAGELGGMKMYLTGVSDVVYLKGSPKKISEALKNISNIL